MVGKRTYSILLSSKPEATQDANGNLVEGASISGIYECHVKPVSTQKFVYGDNGVSTEYRFEVSLNKDATTVDYRGGIAIYNNDQYDIIRYEVKQRRIKIWI